MQHSPDPVVDQGPTEDVSKPDECKRRPGLRDAEGDVEPRERGEREGGVGGAEEGFGAGLDEGCEGDCEFADAEPAGTAVDVGVERVIDRRLDC